MIEEEKITEEEIKENDPVNDGVITGDEEFYCDGLQHVADWDIKCHNVYTILKDDNSVVFIHYIIGYRYEYIFLIIVVLVLMIDVLIPTLLLIKRIKKAILQVSEYTLAIGNDDLSTNIEKTDIKVDSKTVKAYKLAE